MTENNIMYNRIYKRLLLIGIGVLILLINGQLFRNAGATQPELSPVEAIERTVEQLVLVVETLQAEDQTQERRLRMRNIIEPRFDFEEMAKRSLGAQWLSISADEQKEFTAVFSDLLAKTYLDRLENIEKGMVTIRGEKIVNNKALVRTTVAYKDDSFPLDYKLIKRTNTWQVYDVIIENIGLVANYRHEFAGIIRKEKFKGLLDRLKQKVAA